MRKMKQVTTMTTVQGAINSAADEIQDLADELEEWRGNIEEKFSTTDKYSAVEDAASALADLASTAANLDVSDAVASIEIKLVTYQPYGRKGPSRSRRASNAAAALEAAEEAVQGYIDAKREAATAETDLESLQALVCDLFDAVDEINNVEFPGMFG